MNPRELQIDNIVYQNGELTRIYQLDHRFKTMFRINDNQIDERCLEDVFAPVFLTEGIVKDLRFERIGRSKEWKIYANDFSISVDFCRGGILISIETENNYVNTNCSPYVHSIQNLYYNLSGEILNTDKLLYGKGTLQNAEESPSDSV